MIETNEKKMKKKSVMEEATIWRRKGGVVPTGECFFVYGQDFRRMMTSNRSVLTCD